MTVVNSEKILDEVQCYGRARRVPGADPPDVGAFLKIWNRNIRKIGKCIILADFSKALKIHRELFAHLDEKQIAWSTGVRIFEKMLKTFDENPKEILNISFWGFFGKGI